MTAIDKEELPVTTDVDDDLVISFEPIASNVFIRRELVPLDEFALTQIALIPDVLIQFVDAFAGLPHVRLRVTAAPDHVPPLDLLEYVLDELDVFPLVSVLESSSEGVDHRQILDTVVASIPGSTLDPSDVLPLKPPGIWSTFRDVSYLRRIDVDHGKRVDGVRVWTSVPPDE
ncbi:hypothetical protein [Halorubrum sp. DTA98]|uniref:hypothetical protein n=1 Tax=Halorubrum sp. DTA98 TaxID=3402163 RepID=UPI003AAC2AD1